MSSIYVNYNKNFQNQRASKFTTFYSDNITLPPDTTIQLYQAELSKKPISITENQNATLFVDSSSDANKAYVLHNTDGNLLSGDNTNTLTNLTVSVPKNNYTQREFLDKFQQLYSNETTGVININNADDNTDPYFPYKMVARNEILNDNKELFLGLAPDFKNQRFFPITEIGDDRREREVSYQASGNVGVAVDILPTQTQTTGGIYAQYAMGQSACNPLSMVKDYWSDNMMYPAQNILWWSVVDETADSGADKNEYNVHFAPTSVVKAGVDNLAGAKLETSPILGKDFEAPDGFIGINFSNDPDPSGGECVLTVYVANNISTVSSAELAASNPLTGVEFTQKISLTIAKLDENMRFGIQFYYENGTNPLQVSENKFYFRVLSHLNNSKDENDYLEGSNNILYDSKVDNTFISQALISTSFKLETGGYSNLEGTYWSGLVPVFSFGALHGTTDEHYFANIRGNWINHEQSDERRDVIGLLNHSWTSLGKDIQQAFGNNEIIKINPNGYNRFANSDFGIAELFGNTTNYNIHIENLPLKSYVSTDDNNIGGMKPSLYEINNAFSGSLNGLNQGNLIRSIYSQYAKPMKLRNKNEIKLNQLNVKITRGNTNIEAEELTDCKFEILFN